MSHERISYDSKFFKVHKFHRKWHGYIYAAVGWFRGGCMCVHKHVPLGILKLLFAKFFALSRICICLSLCPSLHSFVLKLLRRCYTDCYTEVIKV